MADVLRRVAIVGSARIPFARSNTAYGDASNQDMLTAALSALVDKFGLRGEKLGEVAAGAVIKHSRDWNLTREATQGAGLHPQTPAYDVQRACGTSLTTTVQLAQRIARGEIEAAIAGGVDTTSDAPIVYSKALAHIVRDSARGKTFGARVRPWLRLRPRDLKPVAPRVGEPRTGLSMGEHCELMAKEWKIGRAEQDELAFQSHVKAARAWREGFYADLVAPYGGLATDNNVRSDTSLEKLAALKPVYDRSAAGTLTAGNSTPLTDGASCVLLASETWAQAHGVPIQAWLGILQSLRSTTPGWSVRARVCSWRPLTPCRRCSTAPVSRCRISISTKFTKRLQPKCSARSRPGSRRNIAARSCSAPRRSAASIGPSSIQRAAALRWDTLLRRLARASSVRSPSSLPSAAPVVA